MRRPLLEILDRLGGESRIHYSLDHFTEALQAAGEPHKAVNTIVVSGTNGKGSVALLLASVLREFGMRVGTYLSPHLTHPRERFLENGVPASLETLDEMAGSFEALGDKHGLTYFEFLTLICFEWARRAAFDVLVLEVGMGGRLDATNVTNPLATVITNIDWDHQRYLGNTLKEILQEKAGILRTAVPLFTQIRDAELRQHLEHIAAEMGVRIHYSWKLPRERHRFDWEGQDCSIDGSEFHLTHPSMASLENATTAYELLRNVFPSISTEIIRRGFARMRNPGRFDVVARPGGPKQSPRVILSGDHNPAGIQSLIETLHGLQVRPRILCGFSPDKPARKMIDQLRTVSDDVRLTSISRFEHAADITYRDLAPYRFPPCLALEEILADCTPDDTAVVTGSLYLVGELYERFQDPERR